MCTVYSVQCTVYSVQCTVYSVQCTVYSVQCTVYSVQLAGKYASTRTMPNYLVQDIKTIALKKIMAKLEGAICLTSYCDRFLNATFDLFYFLDLS